MSLLSPLDRAARHPAWLTEPAKLVGWLAVAVIGICATALEVANEVGVLLPGEWQDEIRAVVVAVGAVSLVATRVQALLTRNGIGRPGDYFDGVYSPDTVQIAMKPSPEQMLPGGVGPTAIIPPES